MASSAAAEEPGSPFDQSRPGPTSSSSFPFPSSPSAGDVQQQSSDDARRRRSSTASAQQSRLKQVTNKILDANPPPGMWHATGHIAAKAPTIADIRRGSFGHSGWTAEGQMDRSRTNSASSRSMGASLSRGQQQQQQQRTERESRPQDEIPETPDEHHVGFHESKRDRGGSKELTTHGEGGKLTTDTEKVIAGTMTHEAISANVHDVEKEATLSTLPDSDGVYPNGYKFPPKHTWGQATVIALKGFWRFVLTPAGFLITLYCLNVVAWGGMLFLLLVNAAPAMCRPNCNDINSPRRKWIEIDSQILNALFCVTGFGLVPWRFRDLYYLLKWRLLKQTEALRILAGIHRGWFRLPDSDLLPPTYHPTTNSSDNDPPHTTSSSYPDHSLPLPLNKIPDPPLTGSRAPPTKLWKLDFVIWMYVLNTFLQAVLCGFMWGLNRYDRPSWSTGTFVALACIVAGIAGLMVFKEGKRVKAVEGIPVTEEDLKVQRDLETEVHGGRGRTRNRKSSAHKRSLISSFG